MDNSFQQVKRLTLHDAGITLCPKDHKDDINANWCEYDDYESPAYSIEYDSLELIIKMFNLNIPKNLVQPIRMVKENLTIGSRDEHDDYGALAIIKELSVKIESAKLLTMNITFAGFPEENIDDHVQKITYSGSFTIWWK